MPVLRLTPLALLSLSLSGCGGAPEALEEARTEIVGGMADSGDPAVVALVAHQPGQTGSWLCTASVIAPTVLLTAAHCVLPLIVGAGAIFEAYADPSILTPPLHVLAVSEVHWDPQFDITALQDGHDVAVAILAAPTTITPLPFNAAQLPASLAGQNIRIVGYGVDDTVTQTGAGVKRSLTTTLDSYSGILLNIGTATAMSCHGDSGGPALGPLNGAETIIGITSFGDVSCGTAGYYTRLDPFASFVEHYTATNCIARCGSKICGDDGCGFSCGTCSSTTACTAQGQCVVPMMPAPGGGGVPIKHHAPVTADSSSSCRCVSAGATADGRLDLGLGLALGVWLLSLRRRNLSGGRRLRGRCRWSRRGGRARDR